MIDVLYLAWNRLQFTKTSFELLLENTNWDLVDRLIVYDDRSTDGTRKYLDKAVYRAPVDVTLSMLGFRSPVRTMLHYLASPPAARFFAKIDNDIAVPPGWLDALNSVMATNDDLDLIGMQIGFGGDPQAGWDGTYGYVPAPHIGGVGLMRTSAFTSRPSMHADGRFGFTAWQQKYDTTIGWITPDVICPQLDLIPDEPYRSLAEKYIAQGWQRRWPPYAEASRRYWDWL
jgi:hypothetical protein